ncbi:hypothetical protein ACRALDRAFT_1033775 [Sodiomyces alcalophilus JCM 7366]|uniref:uncharacterized protein n=1 Tax=Sodiomyces alcalophilus JCM 7366 TaxID=591952 RepID=UPI0039B57547
MTTVKFPLYKRLPIGFESAKEHEDDIILRIRLEEVAQKLFEHLWTERRRAIASVAALHAGLDPHLQDQRCVVQEPETWIRGSFNICIPVQILDQDGSVTRTLLVRCPMSHKLAEAQYPGTVDEKVSTEVATYVWMQEHCPDVRIPMLLGFGFTDGRHFTHVGGQPFYIRWARAAWRRLHILLRRPLLSQYVPVRSCHALETGYVVLEYIEPTIGRMLSMTWQKHHNDAGHRRNLFRGLSRLMLTVGRVPLPRIGSWRFHDDGTITLSNRPLTCNLVMLENNGASRVIQPNDTYTRMEPYVWDVLKLHERHFRAQPNAAFDEDDCQYQMAVQVALRAVAYCYLDRDERRDTFVMQFTDLHGSNIFVDDHWNVTAIIDLEWICARPIEMIDVPYWITGRGIDEVGSPEHVAEYTQAREEFITILREEEQKMTTSKLHNVPFAAILQSGWETNLSWFVHCLDSIDGMYNLFKQHLRPEFASFGLSPKLSFFLSKFWCKDSSKFVEDKLRQKERYDAEMRRMFEMEDREAGDQENGVGA